MKRCLAWILAALMLFTACAGLAEAPAEQEKKNPETTAEHLRFLKESLQGEDVRELLQNEDVQAVSAEIVTRTLIWLYRNRPVTMKILTELGIGERDLSCISKLWDSADRLSEAGKEYNESEDGQKLLAEFRAVLSDPEITGSLSAFIESMQSEDILRISRELKESVAAESETPVEPGGRLTREAFEKRLTASSFRGRLILKLLKTVEELGVVDETALKLMRNENLWRLILHLAEESEMDRIFQQELKTLLQDPEINDFLRDTVVDAVTLFPVIFGEPGAEEASETAPDETSEAPAEAAPEAPSEKTDEEAAP